MNSNVSGLISLAICLGVASAVGFLAMAGLMILGDWTLLQALFAAAVIFGVLAVLLPWAFTGSMSGPVEPGTAGVNAPQTRKAAKAASVPATAPAPVAAAPAAPAAPAPEPEPAPAPQEVTEGGAKPVTLEAAREGGADDLKRIKGVGPKMESLLNSMGFYHFDQVAAWSANEVAWVDQNLEGFKGRVTRDNWVEQAKHLAAGGETEFSRKVDMGDVY